MPAGRLEAYREAFGRLAAEGNIEIGEAMLSYVLKTSREANPVALQAARAASPRLTEGVMSIWDQRIEEGEARGRAEGAVGARASMLLEQLGARFGPISADIEARVQSADVETLRRWGVRLMRAQALGEVLEDG